MSSKYVGKVVWGEIAVGRRGNRTAGAWQITAEPHVTRLLKRLFPRAREEAHVVLLADSEEVCRNLLWFMARYPLRIEEPEREQYMAAQAKKHEEREERIRKLLAGEPVEGFTTSVASAAGRQMTMALMALPPRDYQTLGAEVAATTQRLLLGDDLGTGKTITTLTLLTRPETRPAVVVAPGNLIPQWMAQVAKFVPGLTTREAKTGNPEELTRPYCGKVRPLPDVLFITYHKLRGWVDALISAGFRTVIFEEVHELRTGPDSEKWTSAKQLSEAMQYALGLTATPVFNYGGQAYWLFDAIRPGCLGTEMEFAREWCAGASLSSKARVLDGRAFGTYLRREGLMLRRTKRELGISLPKVTRNIQYIDSDLSVIQKAEDAVAELARIVLAQQGFSPMQKLHAGGEMDVRLRKATGIAKAPFVASFVRMLVESGEERPEPVLLSGHHYEVYDIWREHLKDLNPVFWTGRESRTEKQDALKRFLNREAHVFVVANRAGAGLDGLQTVCSTLVEGELDWAGGIGQQLQGRLDRDGQTVPVMRHTLISNSGCDPIMADVLGIKMGQLETINNPEADEVAEVQTDPTHIRNLAIAVLARRGLPVAEVA